MMCICVIAEYKKYDTQQTCTYQKHICTYLSKLSKASSLRSVLVLGGIPNPLQVQGYPTPSRWFIASLRFGEETGTKTWVNFAYVKKSV